MNRLRVQRSSGLPNCLAFVLSAVLFFSMASAFGAALENPQPGSAQSGIGLFSGWSCTGPDIGVAIDGGAPLKIPYGGNRADTASVCGASNTATGFGLLFNFNLLGAGTHTAQLFVNGQPDGSRVSFNVTVPAGEFLTGISRQVSVPDFPVSGRTTVVGWQQSQQNFAIQFVGAAQSESPGEASDGNATTVIDPNAAALENPGQGSFQSGIGLFSGWSCSGPDIGISIDGATPLRIPYGGGRADTAGVCGATNTATGFGLLFNFNVLSAGTHTARLMVNGQPQGALTQFTVTRPAGEFLTGVSKQVTVPDFPSFGRTATLVWQQSQQNFAIQSVSAPQAASAVKGIWTGTTSADESARVIVLADGTYYILYSQPGRAVDAGVIQGNSTAAGGTFASSNGMDFPIAQAAESGDVASPVTVSGSFRAGNDMQLTFTGVKMRTLSAAYVPGSESPPTLASIVGSYTGFSGHADGRIPATVTILADGTFRGANSICSFTGSVTPMSSLAAFAWTFRRTAGGCIFGTAETTGIIHYDEATRQLRGFAPFADRTDQFYVLATRSP